MLLHINGMPGVGKLSVAGMLARAFNIHLVDNHALLNTAYAAGYKQGTEACGRVLGEICTLVYRELATNKGVQHIVMTNALSDDAHDSARFAAVEALAAARNEVFVPVLLTCSLEENRRRVVSEGRKDKCKLTDADQLEKLYAQYTLIHPVAHPHQLAIDTTHLGVENCFRQISRHIQPFVAATPPLV